MAGTFFLINFALDSAITLKTNNMAYARLIMTLIATLATLTATAQTRRAIVIGIGQQEDKAWSKINGDKDVPYVAEMLASAGFMPANITKLVNRQATKAAIVGAFGRLAAQAGRGDMVYVHFSGHGQQMRDTDGDEADGLDECWIPYDAYRKPCARDRGEKHLTDDEVNQLLNAIRNKVGDSGKMLVVIDACHSGDGTRGDDGETTRGVSDIFEAIRSLVSGNDGTAAKPPHRAAANPNARPRAERWITLSACGSDEVNIEMKSPTVGKLTYALYKKAREKPGDGNEGVFRRIRMFVNANTASRPQHPVMSGETGRYKITDILR